MTDAHPHQDGPPAGRSEPGSARLWLVVAALVSVIVGFGIVTIRDERLRLLAAADARLLAAARSVPLLLADDYHDRATGPGAIAADEDARNQTALAAFAGHGGFAYVYCLAPDGEAIRFTADFNTPEDIARGVVTRYWDVYEEVPAAAWQALRTGRPEYASYRDSWGDFRSVYVPVHSPGGRAYLSAADISTAAIAGELAKHTRTQTLLLLLLIGASLVTGIALQRLRLRQWRTANDLRQREAERDRARSFAHAVVANAQAGICVYRADDGACVDANPAAAHLLDQELTTILGRGLRTLDAWRDTGVSGLAERALADGTTQALDTRVGGRWLECSLSLFAVGEERHLLVLFVDATARVGALAALVEAKERAEAVTARLQESEERYRTIVTAMQEGIVVHAADGAIIEANASAERILGLTSDQLRGRTSMDPRWRAVREDGSPFPGDEHAAMVALRTRVAVSGVLMGVHRPDGSQAWISVNAEPLRRPGGPLPYAVVATFHDITARRHAEEALRTLSQAVEQTSAAIVITDAGGRIQYVNPGFVHATGYTPEEALGRNPSILRSGNMPGTVYAEMWRTITAGGTWRGEFKNRRKDGSLFWETAVVSPVRDGRGTITHYLAVKEDITERKRAEEELREANRRLAESNVRANELAQRAEAASQAKGSFLANMSHEIRTPMNGVLGMTELLLKSGLGPEQEEHARTIYRCAESLLTLLNDILDFSRIESGRLELERIPFDLVQAVHDAGDLFAPRIAGTEVELLVRVDPALPRRVLGDPRRGCARSSTTWSATRSSSPGAGASCSRRRLEPPASAYAWPTPASASPPTARRSSSVPSPRPTSRLPASSAAPASASPSANA